MLKAWSYGAVAQAVIASALLQTESRDRVTIIGQVGAAVTLAAIFAPPMLVALWFADSMPSWIWRVPFLAFAVVAELIGYLILAFFSGGLRSILGSETWYAFFGETKFLAQLGPMLASELALLAAALPLWPWVPRQRSVRGPRP